MTERAYTVSEIDQMRSAIRFQLTPVNLSFYQDEVNRQIEEQLRTYMLAGIEPVDLVRECGGQMFSSGGGSGRSYSND